MFPGWEPKGGDPTTPSRVTLQGFTSVFSGWRPEGRGLNGGRGGGWTGTGRCKISLCVSSLAAIFVLTGAPAVHLRVSAFHHFDIQSNAQKSHCVNASEAKTKHKTKEVMNKKRHDLRNRGHEHHQTQTITMKYALRRLSMLHTDTGDCIPV